MDFLVEKPKLISLYRVISISFNQKTAPKIVYKEMGHKSIVGKGKKLYNKVFKYIELI